MNSSDRQQHFSERDQSRLDLIWTEYEQKNALDTFDLALRLRAGARTA